ncbi:MAG: RNA polymerase subunit sigma-24 [Acidobacteria bacterium]|nr:RNA polymerase subunit sigma-24 [Acidobacteriota bacterium]
MRALWRSARSERGPDRLHLARIVEKVFRSDGRRVLAGLVRMTGDLDTAEDALQEATARALASWERDGIPDNPGAWLNTVSRRIAIDRMRRDRSAALPDDLEAAAYDTFADPPAIEDDRLRLLFVCCHPSLSPEASSALALRTLVGLTTREIARAFVEPEPTTAQRIVRAKKKIREAGIPFEIPPRHKLDERIDTVLSVIYLIFNEGYASTEAVSLIRPDLVAEAIRLARLAVELMPESAEAKGLLALLLLTDARRAARISEDGDLVPLEDQDREAWDRSRIDEGTRILDEALAVAAPGPYQIQAAIAALHGTAPNAAETDWKQIALLYRALPRYIRNPVVELNAAVASAMASDPVSSLDWIARIEESGALRNYHLLPASKADLLRRLGRFDEASAAYARAIELVTSPAERRYLEKRLEECRTGEREPAN